MIKRRPRKYVRLAVVEAYWGVGPRTCIRCRATARCERAHVIDRCRGGLDGVQNIVPLCGACHAEMSEHGPGDEDRALAWIHARDRAGWSHAVAVALCAQFPEEWSQAEALDSTEAAIELVRSCQLDYSLLPRTRPAHENPRT